MTTHDPEPRTAGAAAAAALAHRHWRRHVSRTLARRPPDADFPASSVWLLLLTEDGGASRVVELTGALAPPGDPGAPEMEEWAELLGLLARPVREEGGADPGAPVVVSLLRTRPGGGPATPDDLRWLETLERAAEAAGLPCVLHCFASRDLFLVLRRSDLSGAARSA